jgi:hypothetical protein
MGISGSNCRTKCRVIDQERRKGVRGRWGNGIMAQRYKGVKVQRRNGAKA